MSSNGQCTTIADGTEKAHTCPPIGLVNMKSRIGSIRTLDVPVSLFISLRLLVSSLALSSRFLSRFVFPFPLTFRLPIFSLTLSSRFLSHFVFPFFLSLRLPVSSLALSSRSLSHFVFSFPLSPHFSFRTGGMGSEGGGISFWQLPLVFPFVLFGTCTQAPSFFSFYFPLRYPFPKEIHTLF